VKSTDELKKEHKGIELMLRVLKTVAGKLKSGERVNTEHIDSILEFLSIFVDKCHHGKEEEFLFPALEDAGMPREGSLIGVMLSEHEQGRRLVARLKDAVTGYRSEYNPNASNVQLIINEYVKLFTQHIAEENTVLFPMADAKLDSNKDTVIFEAFEQLERERIGVGKHEEFHALLNKLEHEYLR